MSVLSKSIAYATGIATVGGLLYFALTPSPNSEFQNKVNEAQGALSKDVTESKKQTQMLMTKLRAGAGIKPKDE